ncbi:MULTISPECIES: DUF1116 domain-containing protein [unclassified Aureimonas]|uniref:DUF1116 domain-containing protein n=1 Tax=unclassified Aureimonas TaxID=2615206 RepID=UPI000AADD480|nr:MULTISPECIES: DUF1116 domain-containing protein [unclassified Aureimonas]
MSANAIALERIAGARPILSGLERAGSALGLAEGQLGHAGPPFCSLDEIPATVFNALAGAVLHEGWAGTLSEAGSLIRNGKIGLKSNHDLGTVSPMAGVVRPSQIVFRVHDGAGSAVTYATLAEAGRKVLRFGVYDETVAAGLRWQDEVLAIAIAEAIPEGGLAILPLLDDAVGLGDDVHQRNIGGMLAFVRSLRGLDGAVAEWLLGNPQHFLNYAMAAAKLCLDRAQGIRGSSLVTAISRNGVDCAIRIAGAGGRWFRAPATVPDGAFFPPFDRKDAQHDLGDSAIMEAYGLGGTVAHAAPELARAMTCDWGEAREAGRDMRRLFVDRNQRITPVLAGRDGIGLGLDARRVVAEARNVRIHTGIAHRDGATGWIGVGVAEAPLACFERAVAELDFSGETAFLPHPKETP